MNAIQAWQATIGQIQMDMPRAAYETWVSHTELVNHEDQTFIVGVPNAYARDWLESRLTGSVSRILTGLMNSEQTIRFVVQHKEAEQTSEEVSLSEPAQVAAPLAPNPTIINRYTFDNFVVGPNSRMAHAACMAVGENPVNAVGGSHGRVYNPLFIYGGVGLGKTHLLHAIGNAVHQRGFNALYVSSEEFTNDLINSIRTQSTAAFRERYRRTDVLLVDDIQFFAGKEATLEEFFHTFNTLHGQDKQIIISSDRPPKAMVTLEERLRSRFEWGLTVDIQPPDVETRIAILRSKAERAHREVPDEILALIARQIQSNIRELEGALTRVLVYSDLIGQPLTQQLVYSSLADLLPQRSSVVPSQVVKVVASIFGITPEKLLSRDRSRDIALPRQVAMYLLREEASYSLPQIGQVLGGRDHTTVMYACDKIADLIERDDHLRRQVIQIREQLYGHSAYAV
jgi:chromosomal replication initiator protein